MYYIRLGRVSGAMSSGNTEADQHLLVHRLPSMELGEGKVLVDGDHRPPSDKSHYDLKRRLAAILPA